MKTVVRITSLIIVLIIITCSTISAGSHTGGYPNSELIRGQIALEAFDYRGVTIDGGHMKKVYDEVGSSYLKRAVVDDLLKSFRERAGLPAPGKDPGSWYEDGLYHMFGQVVSGLARYYAGSGDIAYKERVDELIHEWGLTIRDDGFFFNVDPGKTVSYVYDKMICGLIDAYLYCGNEEALDYLSKITDWALVHLPRNRHPLNYTQEWYTLSENLYRAYLTTGDERYKEFAQVWHYWEYWDLYANKQDIFTAPPWEGRPDHYHAYSHVNTLSSAAMAYLVTGEDHYFDTIKNAYDFLTEEQIYATGGYGPNERFMPRDQLVEELYSGTHKNFETQCGSWAAFKLSKYLMTITGEAKYGNWVELLLYNGIGASLPDSEEGNVMYSSSYQVRGTVKQLAADPWTCCSGTRPQASADYIDHIYFHDDNNLYVNLFTPSTIVWRANGTDVRLSQSTEFPESDVLEFTIEEAAKEIQFSLRFRNPSWLAGEATASVNGKDVELTLLDSGWLEIDRKWKKGDKVRLTMPMKLYVNQILPDQTYPCAIMYGPVVLAVASNRANNNPANLIDVNNLDESLIPIPGEPLHFKIANAEGVNKNLMLKPFYEFGAGERYYMYLDPKYSIEPRPVPTPTSDPTPEPTQDPTPTPAPPGSSPVPTGAPTSTPVQKDPSPGETDTPATFPDVSDSQPESPTVSDPAGGSPKTGDNGTAAGAMVVLSMLIITVLLLRKKLRRAA